jgi:hypothetical protein
MRYQKNEIKKKKISKISKNGRTEFDQVSKLVLDH